MDNKEGEEICWSENKGNATQDTVKMIIQIEI